MPDWVRLGSRETPEVWGVKPGRQYVARHQQRYPCVQDLDVEQMKGCMLMGMPSYLSAASFNIHQYMLRTAACTDEV